MARKDRSWFEEKVRQLGDALRRLPRSRRDAALDALEADQDPADRQGAGGSVDDDTGESGKGKRPTKWHR